MIYQEVKEARWWVSRAVRMLKHERFEDSEAALMEGAQTLVAAANILRDEEEPMDCDFPPPREGRPRKTPKP